MKKPAVGSVLDIGGPFRRLLLTNNIITRVFWPNPNRLVSHASEIIYADDDRAPKVY